MKKGTGQFKLGGVESYTFNTNKKPMIDKGDNANEDNYQELKGIFWDVYGNYIGLQDLEQSNYNTVLDDNFASVFYNRLKESFPTALLLTSFEYTTKKGHFIKYL